MVNPEFKAHITPIESSSNGYALTVEETYNHKSYGLKDMDRQVTDTMSFPTPEQLLAYISKEQTALSHLHRANLIEFTGGVALVFTGLISMVSNHPEITVPTLGVGATWLIDSYTNKMERYWTTRDRFRKIQLEKEKTYFRHVNIEEGFRPTEQAPVGSPEPAEESTEPHEQTYAEALAELTQ